MTLCNRFHDEVCFVGVCPVCEAVKTSDEKLAQLESDNVELIGTVDALRAKLEKHGIPE